MRGEWIEMVSMEIVLMLNGLSPCGESGLKWSAAVTVSARRCLSPCGESGLKLTGLSDGNADIESLPMRG